MELCINILNVYSVREIALDWLMWRTKLLKFLRFMFTRVLLIFRARFLFYSPNLLRLSVIMLRIVFLNYWVTSAQFLLLYFLQLRIILRGLLASNILSAYRPIQCGGIAIWLPLSCLASYYLSTDLCDVENMYSGYVSHCFLIKSTAGSLRPILWWWGRWNAVS